MTKTRWFLVLPLIAAACGDSSPSTPAPTELRSDKVRVTAPTVTADDAAAFASDNLAFGIDLHLALRANQPDNFIFSQTSISTALAMLYAGAGTTTAAEMATALHFGLPADRLHPAFNALDLALTTPPSGGSAAAFRLAVANSIWLQDGFPVLPAYLDTLATNYGKQSETYDGVDASVNDLVIAGFSQIRALSTRNGEPQQASRPFDGGRDGFVLAEGAGIVVLESEAHARARGAAVLAEAAGGSVTSDANDIVAADPAMQRRVMQKALASAGMDAADIGFIHAHATSTPVGDRLEAQAITAIFGADVPVTSTKGHTGHLLGGAGALAAVVVVQALQTGQANRHRHQREE